MRRDRVVALAILAGSAVIGVLTFSGLRVRNQIADFVPNAEERELADIARAVTDSELSRTIVLEVGPGEAAEVAAAGAELATILEDAPRCSPSDSGAPGRATSHARWTSRSMYSGGKGSSRGSCDSNVTSVPCWESTNARPPCGPRPTITSESPCFSRIARKL